MSAAATDIPTPLPYAAPPDIVIEPRKGWISVDWADARGEAKAVITRWAAVQARAKALKP